MNKVDRLSKAIAYLKGKQIIAFQKDIVALMGMNKSTVSLALKGDKRYLTDRFLQKFCNTFPQININWLLKGEGSVANDIEKSEEVNWNTTKELSDKELLFVIDALYRCQSQLMRYEMYTAFINQIKENERSAVLKEILAKRLKKKEP